MSVSVERESLPRLIPLRQLLNVIPAQFEQLEKISISTLTLSVRSTNCLQKSGLTEIGKVLSVTVEDLLSIRNLGWGCIEDILIKLSERIVG